MLPKYLKSILEVHNRTGWAYGGRRSSGLYADLENSAGRLTHSLPLSQLPFYAYLP